MPQPKKSPENRARPTTITLDPAVHALGVDRARGLGWSFSKFVAALITGDEEVRAPGLREGQPSPAAGRPVPPLAAGKVNDISKWPDWLK